MAYELRFNEDGNIKIMQLTDLHFTNDDEADHKTVELVRQALRDEKPDFVIVTGDMVYGEHNLEFLPKVFAPLTEGDCPWTFVFGNHDSEWGHSRKIGGYACITRNQIDWYQAKIRELESKHKDFSALAFQHIAVPEHQEVFKYEKCYGVKREGSGAPRLNSGFFYALIEAGHTKGLFVGHDHANDYYGNLYGITLGY